MGEARKLSPEAPEKVAAQAVKDATPKEDARVYEVARLTGPEAYDLTGYEGHVVAGALHSVRKKNLTAEEATAAVKAWLSAPSQQEG